MQIAADETTRASVPGGFELSVIAKSESPLSEHKVIRRNGAVVGFEPGKISVAMAKAFLAVNGGQGAASARIRELVATLTDAVVRALARRQRGGGTFHIEDIQDQVELALMRSGEHEVARAYVLYREKRAAQRAQEAAQRKPPVAAPQLHVIEQGTRRPLDLNRLSELMTASCDGLEGVEPKLILQETLKNLYDGVPAEEVRKSAILSARALIEKDPAYSYVTARLLLNDIRREVLGEEVSQADMKKRYAEYLPQFLKKGIQAELLDPRLATFDSKKLGKALDASREQIGIDPLYPGTSNPFPWMSEMIDLKKERNFFETRVIEYQTGGALSWD